MTRSGDIRNTCDYIYPTRDWAAEKVAGERCGALVKTATANRCVRHKNSGKHGPPLVLGPRSTVLR